MSPIGDAPAGEGIRLLLLADTHLPLRARDLPDAVWDEVDRADVVVHAGDWVDVATLDRLQARSRSLLACWGNNDGPELRARLPEVARATLGGVRVAVVHDPSEAIPLQGTWFGSASDHIAMQVAVKVTAGPAGPNLMGRAGRRQGNPS